MGSSLPTHSDLSLIHLNCKGNRSARGPAQDTHNASLEDLDKGSCSSAVSGPPFSRSGQLFPAASSLPSQLRSALRASPACAAASAEPNPRVQGAGWGPVCTDLSFHSGFRHWRLDGEEPWGGSNPSLSVLSPLWGFIWGPLPTQLSLPGTDGLRRAAVTDHLPVPCW